MDQHAGVKKEAGFLPSHSQQQLKRGNQGVEAIGRSARCRTSLEFILFYHGRKSRATVTCGLITVINRDVIKGRGLANVINWLLSPRRLNPRTLF
jgi:hypothetical protein